MNVNWKGVYPAVTTKFFENGELDLDNFAINIEAQIQAGVHAIVLGGTLGEASTLTNEEKLALVRETKKIANGRIPVIVNIAESRTEDAIAFVKSAEQAGANGLMLLPPMRYNADDRETVHYFGRIAKSTQLPIMIYNNPVDYKIEVTLDMFEELKQYENIQAVKESTRDISNITRMRNRFGDRYMILSGVDTLAMESLVMGADGWVAGLVCAFPAETVAIYNYVKDAEIEKARDIYRWFLPLLELDINAKLVQNIKLAELATGIGTQYVREPRLLLEGEEKRQVEKIINDALASRPKLN
ncbi:MAG: dihydrodipicolinate synthase family protein [Crocinitomix sp.]|nr:dihydrodipicolinate synthase family protein [Crocinitomix sp.]